jgi:acetyltransferase
MSAGRIAARAKPVIVVKAGRSAAGAKAALSHTGSLAGADAVYDAAFRRAGMLRVYSLRELFEAAMTLAAGLKPEGARLAILTNGGGAGVLATDALEHYGGDLAELSRDTIAELDKVLPATWSHANPVDILGDATGRRYADALRVLAGDPGAHAILVMNCPTAVADSREAAEAVLAALPERGKPILACWLGETAAREARQLLAARRVPAYEAPDEAVRALMHLVQYRRNQHLLMETPPASPAVSPVNREAARAVAANVLAEGRTTLTEPEAKELLHCYGIPTVKTFTAESPARAARLATELGRPVALKILSPDITHKSDVGGVHLDLDTPAAVETAANAMLARVRERIPTARIAGFTVQEMVHRPRDVELILGIAEDSLFGPVLMFGQGGVAVEVIGDRTIALPPLNMVLAREMIERTRIAKLLAGYRDRPPADVAAIARTLVRLSELLVDLPELVELDINPLLAGPDGVLALDARIVVRPLDPARSRVLAIQPYPAGLEHCVEIDGGKRLIVRPIRPEDEPRLVEMVERSSPEDVRLRFLGALKEFPHLMAARLSQIDYDREMALVAIDPEEPTRGEIVGVSRIVADPENDKAEYAVMVRSDLKGRGLGFQLMKDILAYARRRGIKTVEGDVLAENRTMLQMAAELGFVRQESEGGVVRVGLNL